GQRATANSPEPPGSVPLGGRPGRGTLSGRGAGVGAGPAGVFHDKGRNFGCGGKGGGSGNRLGLGRRSDRRSVASHAGNQDQDGRRRPFSVGPPRGGGGDVLTRRRCGGPRTASKRGRARPREGPP